VRYSGLLFLEILLMISDTESPTYKSNHMIRLPPAESHQAGGKHQKEGGKKRRKKKGEEGAKKSQLNRFFFFHVFVRGIFLLFFEHLQRVP
jgi:hypothetical protein